MESEELGPDLNYETSCSNFELRTDATQTQEVDASQQEDLSLASSRLKNHPPPSLPTASTHLQNAAHQHGFNAAFLPAM